MTTTKHSITITPDRKTGTAGWRCTCGERGFGRPDQARDAAQRHITVRKGRTS